MYRAKGAVGIVGVLREGIQNPSYPRTCCLNIQYKKPMTPSKMAEGRRRICTGDMHIPFGYFQMNIPAVDINKPVIRIAIPIVLPVLIEGTTPIESTVKFVQKGRMVSVIPDRVSAIPAKSSKCPKNIGNMRSISGKSVPIMNGILYLSTCWMYSSY